MSDAHEKCELNILRAKHALDVVMRDHDARQSLIHLLESTCEILELEAVVGGSVSYTAEKFRPLIAHLKEYPWP